MLIEPFPASPKEEDEVLDLLVEIGEELFGSRDDALAALDKPSTWYIN